MSAEIVYQLRKAIYAAPGEHQGRKLTCIPSAHDPRNYQYSKIVPITAEANPAPIDYRPNMPPVNNQGERGCCTSEAWIGTVAEFKEVVAGDEPTAGLSVAFHYSLEKTIDGMPNEEGSTPIAGAKVLQQFGDYGVRPISAIM